MPLSMTAAIGKLKIYNGKEMLLSMIAAIGFKKKKRKMPLSMTAAIGALKLGFVLLPSAPLLLSGLFEFPPLCSSPVLKT